MITQVNLYCAAAALVAALYHHGLFRLAIVLKRKFHVPTLGLTMLPLVALTIGLLYLELSALETMVPNLAYDIGGASLVGLAIGRMVPLPGGGTGARFGFGGGDQPDDGGDDQFDGDDDGDGGGS